MDTTTNPIPELLPFATGPRRAPRELFWNHLTARWETAAEPGVAASTPWESVAPVSPA